MKLCEPNRKTGDRRMLKRLLLAGVLTVCSATAAMAQIGISGVVSDPAGEPVAGVYVSIGGTLSGTVTDAAGRYSINAPGGEAQITFTLMGYVTHEQAVGGESTINVTLQQDAAQIDEVVVVGYGVQRKSVVTAAISSVDMESAEPVATQRVDQMLQGRAAGVLVLNTDGSPGGNTTIRIRGMNSIQGGNSALIVVDGFQGASLTALNPSDIASIEILKDASATAIYGAQGANGVVLITTKRGTSEKPVITYSSEMGFSNLMMGGVELMGAADYAREMNLYEMANNQDRVPVPIFSDAEIAEFERTGGTDWIKEVYRTGVTQNHRISMSGKSQRVSYYASGAIYDEKGIMINSGYKRYSLRANMLADITDWVQFDLNWDLSQQDKYGAQFGGSLDWPGNPVMGAFSYAPTLPVYDEAGEYSKPTIRYGDPTLWNPVASALEPLNENETTGNNINLYLNFRLAQGLTLRAGAGISLSDYNVRRFFNTKTFQGTPDNGQGHSYHSKSKGLQSSNVLTYDASWGDHNLNAILVGELKTSRSYHFEVNASNFASQDTSVWDLAGASNRTVASSFSERKILSGVTRVTYSYADRYMFTGSFRADGSSVFGANNKWGYFPSASVGWRISQEEFMQDLDMVLMLRASWGRTGNQAISAYQTLAKISSMSGYPYDGGSGTNLAYQISSAANPNLKWETTRQANVGIDMGFFRNRLRVTAEYYDKVTDDLLMSRELPRTTGLSQIIDNIGSMGNKGWEFQVDGDINFGDLAWTTGVSLSFPKTTVISLGDDDFLSYSAGGSGHSVNIPMMFLREGQPFGLIEGFGYEGTWKTGQEEEAARYGQMPGDPRYTDRNNDGNIDYDNDFGVIGNAMPDLIYGWSNQFRFRNWEMTFLFQGTLGNDLFNVSRTRREGPTGYSVTKLDRWTPDNQDTDIPALFDDQYRNAYRDAWDAAHPDQPMLSTITFPTSGSNANARWIEDASYLRLKNLTLSYNLPMKKHIQNLRIYGGATNLLTITGYSGFDPEVSSFTGSDMQLGTDFHSYPTSRYYNFGVEITF
ncbi:MAG: TonB-dependent receptor [Alistipes sp.]|jgi:TonB-linked SusC/RagA family outer membrane protein|nr:TonB-dependent receptor [Alistipes sp.]